MQKVAQVARGYVYYVSLKGVTGAGNIDTSDVAERLAQIRKHVSVPVGVGFGIRDADSARRLGEHADAVVIGSKLIETMERAVESAQQAGVRPAEIDALAIKAASDWLASVHLALQ
jgi:tryptophan synthase alpha chain